MISFNVKQDLAVVSLSLVFKTLVLMGFRAIFFNLLTQVQNFNILLNLLSEMEGKIGVYMRDYGCHEINHVWCPMDGQDQRTRNDMIGKRL